MTKETLRIMELAQAVQMEGTSLNQMAQLLHQFEMMGNLREQTIIQLRMMFPEIEKALMELINSNTALQRAYVVYLQNLREVAAFNHTQAHKLDSLTTHYYFSNPSPAQPMNYPGNGVNFYGDRQVHLFLNNIYNHQEHMQKFDNRLQLATAPVVLVNHFAADKDPVNGRLKMLAIFLLLGWFGGCALAELIDKRKAIRAWLRGE